MCLEDKVEILRAVTRSLDIGSKLKNDVFQFCEDMTTSEKQSKTVFRMKLSIDLHSGGTLHLALSDQDKILIMRAFVLSLPIKDQLLQNFLVLLDDYEQKSKPIDTWKLKLDGAKAVP